jgi:hypothetical protein
VLVGVTYRDATAARQALRHRAVAIGVDSPGVDPHRHRAVRARFGVHLAGALAPAFRRPILPPIHGVHIGRHELPVEREEGRQSLRRGPAARDTPSPPRQTTRAVTADLRGDRGDDEMTGCVTLTDL